MSKRLPQYHVAKSTIFKDAWLVIKREIVGDHRSRAEALKAAAKLNGRKVRG